MGKITVVGVGFEIGQLTLDAINILQSGARVLLHTERCGCAEWLTAQSIPYETLDALYESCEDFDEHARLAALAAVKASKDGDVAYAVMDVRDRSVGELARIAEEIRVVAGPPAEGALFSFSNGAVQMLAASDWESFELTSSKGALIREMDTRELAAEVKLKLMDAYPEECDAYVLSGNDGFHKIPLYNLDRLRGYDHKTCVFVPAIEDLRALERFDYGQFKRIIERLCAPGGCPWDRAQTHKSLRPYIIEEAYEVVEAIDEEDPYHLYDELGDMLLQIVLHADIGRRHGTFDDTDVISAISEKMLRRHSHIFGEDSASSAEQVADLWSKNKMRERGQATYSESLRQITKTLPATLRAVKGLKRFREAGLCDTEARACTAALAGEIKKLNDAKDMEAGIGAALMRIMQIAELSKVDPEIALNNALDEMIAKFEQIEQELLNGEERFEDLPREKLEIYWDFVKLSVFCDLMQE